MGKSKQQFKNDVLTILLFLGLSSLCVVFSILYISKSNNAFLSAHRALFFILSAAIFASAFTGGVFIVYKKKTSLIKAFLSGFIFIAVLLILLFIMQATGLISLIQDSERLQAFLEQAGIWMPLSYIFLQFLQVVILPIPSIVSTAVGVALFGAFPTTVYSLIGILSGSFLAFVIGRRFGNKTVAWIVGDDTLKHWQKKLKGKDNLFLSAMFLLPFFPDDILCFLAGLSTMPLRYFLGVIFVSRFLAITATCYSVDFIPMNTWWGIMLWVTFLIGIVAAFIIIYKNMDKIQKFLEKRWKIFRKDKKK